MGDKYFVEKFCRKVYDMLNKKEFIEASKMRKQDFSRNRKMGFAEIAMMILNKTGKNLRSGIRAFMNSYQKETESYSNQAFSKGRQHINYEAFKKLLQMSVEEFYGEISAKTFNNYRVLTVDGTKLNLPYNEESITEFGIPKNTNNHIQALASCLYDVLNEMIIDASIAPFDSFEGDLAKQHLEYLSTISNDKELIMFDRGYPSKDLLKFIEDKGFKFLMRCSTSFIKGMQKYINSDDCTINYKFYRDETEYKIRIVTIKLSNGQNEYLITNIFNDFTKEDFAELYHMRWEIETNYDDIKNKLEIENFSGNTPLAIKQDFFATMFLRNLASMMIWENAEEINKLHNSKGNKYKYKANTNAVISVLKEDLIKMLVTNSKRKRKVLWEKIYNELSMAVIPIRPNRHFARKMKH